MAGDHKLSPEAMETASLVLCLRYARDIEPEGVAVIRGSP